MSGTVKVLCKLDGTVEVSVNGVMGASCKDVTAALQRAFGGEVVSDEPTAEMFEEPATLSDVEEINQ